MDFLQQIPPPATKRLAVHVTAAAERALRGGHPWLFDQAITRQSHAGQTGDLAVIFDSRRRFLAIGLYDADSPLRVRILHQGRPATIDRAWFAERSNASAALRAPLAATDTDGYRLIHGENDGLPGLIADLYGDTVVMKLYTAAWIPHLRDLLPALRQAIHAERLLLRLSRQTQNQPAHLYGLREGQLLWGAPFTGPLRFRENGLLFEVDPIHGQKTGFFLDQRENRMRVEQMAHGRTVLNVFAYSGGFSLYAARGGARRVVSLDSSQPALAAAERNFALNRSQPQVAAAVHETLVGDAFVLLAELGRQSRPFDLVVIDPPAFAKSQAEIPGALAAYERLVRLGLGVLQAGGLLVIASCSSRVTAADFFALVHETARQAGRPLQEIARTGHPLDHPITFPEGAYLKCLFAGAP